MVSYNPLFVLQFQLFFQQVFLRFFRVSRVRWLHGAANISSGSKTAGFDVSNWIIPSWSSVQLTALPTRFSTLVAHLRVYFGCTEGTCVLDFFP
jgi:hypothetical protein